MGCHGPLRPCVHCPRSNVERRQPSQQDQSLPHGPSRRPDKVWLARPYRRPPVLPQRPEAVIVAIAGHNTILVRPYPCIALGRVQRATRICISCGPVGARRILGLPRPTRTLDRHRKRTISRLRTAITARTALDPVGHLCVSGRCGETIITSLGMIRTIRRRGTRGIPTTDARRHTLTTRICLLYPTLVTCPLFQRETFRTWNSRGGLVARS